MIDFEWLSQHLESRYRSSELTECFLGTKFADGGYWSNLCYSQATGWQQILYFMGKLEHDISILKIVYYPTALDALLDNSIFPKGSIVCFS